MVEGHICNTNHNLDWQSGMAEDHMWNYAKKKHREIYYAKVMLTLLYPPLLLTLNYGTCNTVSNCGGFNQEWMARDVGEDGYCARGRA